MLTDYQGSGNPLPQADQEICVRDRLVIRNLSEGWKICCLWKDGATLSEKLSKVKEPHPVQVAEFVLVQGINHELAFN